MDIICQTQFNWGLKIRLIVTLTMSYYCLPGVFPTTLTFPFSCSLCSLSNSLCSFNTSYWRLQISSCVTLFLLHLPCLIDVSLPVFEPSVAVVSTLHTAVSEATEDVPTQERDALLVVLYENTIIDDNGTLIFSNDGFSGFFWLFFNFTWGCWKNVLVLISALFWTPLYSEADYIGQSGTKFL